MPHLNAVFVTDWVSSYIFSHFSLALTFLACSSMKENSGKLYIYQNENCSVCLVISHLIFGKKYTPSLPVSDYTYHINSTTLLFISMN